eukprot:COSAG01_NODE_1466_length_10220_cov_15.883608_4_plen_31_part_00
MIFMMWVGVAGMLVFRSPWTSAVQFSTAND